MIDFAVTQSRCPEARKLFMNKFGSIQTFDNIVYEHVCLKFDNLLKMLQKMQKPGKMLVLDSFEMSEEEDPEITATEANPETITNFFDDFEGAANALAHFLESREGFEVAKLLLFHGFKDTFALNPHLKRIFEMSGIDMKPFKHLGLTKTCMILDKTAQNLNGKKSTQRLLRVPLCAFGTSLGPLLSCLKRAGVELPGEVEAKAFNSTDQAISVEREIVEGGGADAGVNHPEDVEVQTERGGRSVYLGLRGPH